MSKSKSAFISYCHKDREWLDELLIHLAPLKFHHDIELWTDRDIQAGQLWLNDIETKRDTAIVAILLVTPNFLASKFIQENEFGPFLKKAKDKVVRLMWIPVETSSYKLTELKDYQSVISPTRPVASYGKKDRDEIWVQVVEAIWKVMKS